MPRHRLQPRHRSAIALGLAHEGALVAVHYGRDEQAAQHTVALIEKDGVPVPQPRPASAMARAESFRRSAG